MNGLSAAEASSNPNRWLFLDMNSFFATCEQQDRPELRGRPVGIAPVVADTTCCIAASYEAKACGVKTGTGIREARELCPNIEIVEARPRLYRDVHFRIVEAVGTEAPVHEVLSVDEMVVKPWGNEATLADALRLGQRVQDAIRRDVGEWMTCSVGIAPNPFLAKVASDFQKPRGLSVIEPDDIPHKLHNLALTDWPGIASGMSRRFAAAGVTTTEQMYALSLADMRRIFDSVVGERWWRLIRGQNVSMPRIKRWQVGHSNVLAPEFRTPAGSWAIACRLLEKAAERLRDEGFHARRLAVAVDSFDGQRWARYRRFAPCNRTSRFLSVMEGMWDSPVEAPSHVHVSLQDIILSTDVTLDLFEDDPEDDILETVIDKVNQRFGRGTLTVASSLSAKDYLDHSRIPFGKPSALR